MKCRKRRNICCSKQTRSPWVNCTQTLQWAKKRKHEIGFKWIGKNTEKSGSEQQWTEGNSKISNINSVTLEEREQNRLEHMLMPLYSSICANGAPESASQRRVIRWPRSVVVAEMAPGEVGAESLPGAEDALWERCFVQCNFRDREHERNFLHDEANRPTDHVHVALMVLIGMSG